MDKITSKLIFIIAGPMAFISLQFLGDESFMPENSWDVASVAVWMLLWWVSEVIPIFATALLPIVLFPLLKVFTVAEATAPYASSIIFLFMGGFILALAMEKHQLHRRIALNLIKLTGTNANGIILGFMLATAVLSMWISNTATTVMMLPIGLSVVRTLQRAVIVSESFKKFGTALFLGIAYAANIGGMGTIIGTPPNVVLVGLMEELANVDIGFTNWLIIGFPAVIVMFTATYFILVHVQFKNRLGNINGATQFIEAEIRQLGKLSRGEKGIMFVFSATALTWVFKNQINFLIGEDLLNDSVTAMAGALLTFLLPLNRDAKMLMEWEDMKKLPWGILILFGGGMTLAKAMAEAGFVDQIGQWVSSSTVNSKWLIGLLLTAIALFLTELMSNVALTTIAIPMIISISAGLGVDAIVFAAPVALASSCAFMMPISTPPNAIVFSSGYISIRSMIRAGLLLNIIAIIVLFVAGYYLAPFL